jgi:hypothetical protein
MRHDLVARQPSQTAHLGTGKRIDEHGPQHQPGEVPTETGGDSAADPRECGCDTPHGSWAEKPPPGRRSCANPLNSTTRGVGVKIAARPATPHRSLIQAPYGPPRWRPCRRAERRLRARIHRVALHLLIEVAASACSGEIAYLSTIADVVNVRICRVPLVRICCLRCWPGRYSCPAAGTRG